MFKTLMVPVDLAHLETLGRALNTAGDLARHYKAKVIFVGVTAPGPTKVAQTIAQYSAKLDAFAAQQAAEYGIEASAHSEIAGDPTTEVDDALLRAIDHVGADLVVMASHVPGLLDYIWPSNGGKLAEHAKISVMVVRS